MQQYLQRIWKYLPWLIIWAGIVLRIYVYVQNRGLWTDEVAVALNIADRTFAGLAQPLDYHQYAPPLFLWMVKLSAIMFGYGEQALRLYPLLAGMAVLFMFYMVLKQHVRSAAIWYPLLLLAGGVFFTKYSTELKQYMPDALITLLLVWLAGRMRLTTGNARRFAWVWMAAGSAAIWSSMPSVFILAGVGCYYAAPIIARKRVNETLPILLVSLAWAAQFVLYYFTVLKAQISSDYLVGYHSRYFLQWPFQSGSMKADMELLKAIRNEAMGSGYIGVINSLLVSIGILVLLFRRSRRFLLLVLPVLLLLLAALLKQYSLIPRLALFAMPLLLLLVAIALDAMMRSRRVTVICSIGLLVLTVAVNPLKAFHASYVQEEMKDALQFLCDEKIDGKQLVVYTGAIESFRYYTEVHPRRKEWVVLQGACFVQEDFMYEWFSRKWPERSALLYTIPFDSYETKSFFERTAILEKEYNKNGCSVFIFKKKGLGLQHPNPFNG